MKKNVSSVLIILLIITQVMSYFKISNLERRIEQTSSEIWDLHDTVNNKIDSIYCNVDEKLEEQASYIEHIETTIGTANMEDFTVPISYTIIPKEISNKTALSLDFNGKMLEMERTGTSFSLTVDTEIFNPEIHPNIIIFEDDITKTEQNDLLYLHSVKDEIFPNASILLLGLSRGNSQRYKRTGTISWYTKPPGSLSKPIKFTEARLVIKVNDSIIADKPIDINNLDGYEVDEEISLKDGQTCTMTIIVKDSLNLEHHYTIDTYVQGNSSQREPLFDDEKIYSEDGTLLWSQE